MKAWDSAHACAVQDALLLVNAVCLSPAHTDRNLSHNSKNSALPRSVRPEYRSAPAAPMCYARFRIQYLHVNNSLFRMQLKRLGLLTEAETLLRC